METSKVTFPMLTDNEIVDCLSEIVGVQQATVKNLTKPEPEFIYVLYENIVQKLMGITSEDLAKPLFEPYNALEHPQLYDSAIYQITFMRNLFKIMKAAGVDFRMSDLFTPTYPRIRRILSAIINFAKYREDKFADFDEISQKGEHLTDELTFAEENEQLALEELRAIKAEIASEEPESRELCDKLTELNKSINEWNQTQAKSNLERTQLKQQLSETRKRTERYAAQRVALEETKAALLSKTLSDPEAAIKFLEEMRVRQQKENEALSSAEKRHTELVTRRDQIEKSRKSVDKCVALCQEISEELDRLNAEKKEIKEQKNKILLCENALRELDVNSSKLTRQIGSAKERATQIQQQHQEALESSSKQLENARNIKNVVEKDHAAVVAKIKELDLEIAKLETDENTITRQYTEQTNGIKSQISNLISSLRSYHMNLHNAMKETLQQQQQQILSQPKNIVEEMSALNV